jgi:hypothetical protein
VWRGDHHCTRATRRRDGRSVRPPLAVWGVQCGGVVEAFVEFGPGALANTLGESLEEAMALETDGLCALVVFVEFERRRCEHSG